jgi:hypothetical protein
MPWVKFVLDMPFHRTEHAPDRPNNQAAGDAYCVSQQGDTMAHEQLTLGPSESDLVGHWVRSGDTLEPDAICNRIKRLTAEVLEPLASSRDGWDTLYQDPHDGRLWEHTYPTSEMHGGGPPRLKVIPTNEASAKYAAPWGRVALERRTVGRWAEQYLAGQLSFKDFMTVVPEEPADEDVAELIDLIEHEPKKGGIFGVRAKEHDRYMARIRQLVQSLTECESSG